MKNTAHNQGSYALPISVVTTGLLIAVAIFWTSTAGSSSLPDTQSGTNPAANFRLPDESDHVRGAADAKVSIVEFSDLECPFCARIHPTLNRIVNENEDVKWVFRHFPLSTIHSRALSAAIASECIAQLGGNDNFWSFVDSAFANQSQLGDAWYRERAASFGIDAQAFASCVNDKSIVADIQTDLDEATGNGGRGTPYVVVVSPSGRLLPFSGALPYEQIQTVIAQALAN